MIRWHRVALWVLPAFLYLGAITVVAPRWTRDVVLSYLFLEWADDDTGMACFMMSGLLPDAEFEAFLTELPPEYRVYYERQLQWRLANLKTPTGGTVVRHDEAGRVLLRPSRALLERNLQGFRSSWRYPLSMIEIALPLIVPYGLILSYLLLASTLRIRRLRPQAGLGACGKVPGSLQ